MTRRRFIADDFSGDRAALVGEHAAHLARVLRAQVGQDFDIATGDVVRRGVISRVAPDRVDFDLGEAVAAVPSAPIHLVLAIYKFDRLEWAIEKCTELGVARITPAIAKRTDAHLAAAAAKRRERWQRIAQQAAEQSRRVSPPEIAAPVKLAEALPAAGLRIVLAEMEPTARLRDVMEAAAGQGAIHLAIGPEGGWTEEEMKLFQTSGWVAASLGKTILRAETAAIAATALAASALASF
jgi:16S rRNA (uracil1498-N3)-methyltransferase